MIIGGEKMRFTSEKRPFLHKYTVENADFCLKLKKLNRKLTNPNKCIKRNLAWFGIDLDKEQAALKMSVGHPYR